MKYLITSAALATAVLFSSPALAQNSEPGTAVQTSASGTTAKSLQADSTKPHKATVKKHAMNNAMNSSDANTGMVNQNPNAPGDKSTGGH